MSCSEEAMLKMDNVMLKEESEAIQQQATEDEQLKAEVEVHTLFTTFPTCDP